MKQEDIPQVLALQKVLEFQNWTARDFERELTAPYAHAIIAEKENVLMGYAVFHLLGSDSELLTIAVSKDFQKQGVGKLLLEDGVKKLDFSKGDVLFLEVRLSNLNAQNFYKKNNFIPYAERKNYYADSETAVLMKRTF